MTRHTHALRVATTAVALCLCAQASGRTGSPAAPEKASLTIHLERLIGEHAIPMHADHVFAAGDTIRFRLTSGVDGYLYVINQGSSGGYSALFPATGGNTSNDVRKGSDYLVPAVGDGWFQVDGPAGFDTLYFLVSPLPLNLSAQPSPSAPAQQATPPPSMTPRCNDAIFQARGECVDSTAGPAPLARDAPLPPQMALAATTASRDIVLVNDDDGAVNVSAPASGPVIYTFRLAHR